MTATGSVFIPDMDLADVPGPEARGTIVTLGGAAFGTSWQVKAVFGGDAVKVQARLEACLNEIDMQMSPYKPASDLCRFNAAGAWVHVPLPARLLTVVRHALEVAHLTDGAFDPCLLEAVETWGFGSRIVDTGLPNPQALAGLNQAKSDWRDLVWQDGGLIHPGGLRLDLCAIAKGYAVDAIAEILRDEFSVASALIEVGGELKGFGVRPDGQPWWVEIEGPPMTGAEGRHIIALCGWAVAVSGDWRRTFTHDGATYGHTIDPATGSPLTNGMIGAVVMDRHGWRADALATALMVMGADKALAFSTAHDIPALLMIKDGGSVREGLSPRMQAFGADEYV